MKGTFWRKFPTSTLIPKTAGLLFLKMKPLRKVGQEVACSVQNITIGRQIAEEDVFYTLPSSSDAKKLLNKFTQRLSSEERNTLNEIVEIQRKIDPAYGY